MNVSVVMNTYNESPAYLKAAINSYLSQKKVNVQLIVSTIEGDKSINLIPKWYGDKVHVCISTKKEHPGRGTKGVYYQINKAMPLVTGEWFCYASSNDVAIKGKLYTEVSACIKHNKDVCYSDYLSTDKNLKNGVKKRFPAFNFLLLLKGNFISDCAMIRTSTLRNFLPFDAKYDNCGFWDLWLRVYAVLGDVFVHSSRLAFMYRRNSQSLQKERNKRSPKQLKIYHQQRTQMRVNILKKYPLYRKLIISSENKMIAGVYKLKTKGSALTWIKIAPTTTHTICRDQMGWVLTRHMKKGTREVARPQKKKFLVPPALTWPDDIVVSYKARITSP